MLGSAECLSVVVGVGEEAHVELPAPVSGVRQLKRLRLPRGVANVSAVLNSSVTASTSQQLQELLVDSSMAQLAARGSTAQLAARGGSTWPALQQLDLSHMRFKGLPSSMPALQSLSLHGMVRASSGACSRLGHDLAHCSASLTSLDISCNSALCTSGLARVLSALRVTGLPQLRVLRLGACGLNELAGQVLCAAAASLPELQELWLNDEPNDIGDETVADLLAGEQFPQLHTLVLAASGITVAALVDIVDASQSRAFRHLDLAHMAGWDDQATFPMFWQGSWPQLRELRLGSGIEDLELLAVCPFPMLERLDLSGNEQLEADSVLLLEGSFPHLAHVSVENTAVSTDDDRLALAAAFPAVQFSF